MSSRNDLRRALDEVAFRQRGYFTAAQARGVGYSYQAQKYHADRGNWTRIDRGLFRLPGWPPSGEDQYARLCLRLGGRAAVSHETALSIHGFSDVNPSNIHLTLSTRATVDDDAVVLHRGLIPDDEIERREGWAVTTVERTLADVAASSSSQEHLNRAVSGAVAVGRTTARRLRRRADSLSDGAALRIERALSALSDAALPGGES